MSETLTYNDSITRIGYTTIDNVAVMQHTFTFHMDNPQEIHISSIKMNKELYKANRDVCRADMAEFEDLAYAFQDKYISEQASDEEEETESEE